jgi:hypothetical protein
MLDRCFTLSQLLEEIMTGGARAMNEPCLDMNMTILEMLEKTKQNLTQDQIETFEKERNSDVDKFLHQNF